MLMNSAEFKTHEGNAKKLSAQNINKLSIMIAISTIAIIIFSYALIFSFSPINGEDYGLSLQPQQNELSFTDHTVALIKRSYYQATHWNARLGEQLSIFLLSIPKPLFIIINTSTFLVFCAALSKISSGRGEITKDPITRLFLTIAAVFTLWPRYEIFFWQTTAAGYLIPITITLLTIVFFQNPDLLKSKSNKVSLITLCILSGYSFENVPPAVLPYMFLIVFLEFRSRTSARWILATASITYAFSWLALMLTPSTIYRAKWYRETLKIPAPSVEFYLSQAQKVFFSFISTSSLLLLATVIMLLAYVKLNHKAWINHSLPALLIPLILCVLSVLASPYIEPRAFLLAWCILIALLVSWTTPVLKSRSPRFSLLATTLLSLMSLSMASYILSNYVDFSQKVGMRLDQVESARLKQCSQEISFPIIRKIYDPRILNNRDVWVEYNLEQVGKYFGCNLKTTQQ